MLLTSNKRWLLLFIVISVLSVITILILRAKNFLISNYSAVFIGIASIVIIGLTILIFLPKEFGRRKLRRMLFIVCGGIATSVLWLIEKSDLIKEINKLILEKYPQISNYFPITDLPIIAAILVLLVLLIALHYCIRDFSAMKTHQNSFDEEFPEKDFKERLKAFCKVLENRLNQLDIDTNWSDAHFTPLDAEVEILNRGGRKRRVSNLLTAIKKDNKSKAILVLGDPGAGKSVALRKLSRDLLKDVISNYKIPIYINLKEWQIQGKWTEQVPPKHEDLFDFVIKSLKGKDVFADEFIDKYFKRLLENGHVFLIFDSFDEIPSVLDVDESSWLIDKLSLLIFEFLSGAHDSRGVLASRLFRRPSAYFQTKTILDIRPFSEIKIVKALKKYILFDKNLINALFKERQELIPIASNPFSVGLIYNYAKDNENRLPQNQAELYSSYIHKRLDACKNKIKESALTNDIVIDGAIEIANYMFNKENLGLEASVLELKSVLKNKPIEHIVQILVYARIGRLGGGSESRFSFVHRRFNEYFVVLNLIKNPQKVLLEAIPTDSRYRDALVLYCEVADENDAVKIADFCWNEIQKIKDVTIGNPQYLRSIHCLRFIKEAYRNRLECLYGFRSKLTDLIALQIEEYRKTGNALFVKFSIEAIGLTKSSDIQNLLIKSFNLRNEWLNDTAIKSCRHLPNLDKELEQKIREYLISLDTVTFLRRREELLFSLRLSGGFNNIYRNFVIRDIDLKIALISVGFLFFIQPLIAIFTCIVIYSEMSINPALMLKSLDELMKVKKKGSDSSYHQVGILFNRVGFWRIQTAAILFITLFVATDHDFVSSIICSHFFNLYSGEVDIEWKFIGAVCILFLIFPMYNLISLILDIRIKEKKDILILLLFVCMMTLLIWGLSLVIGFLENYPVAKKIVFALCLVAVGYLIVYAMVKLIRDYLTYLSLVKRLVHTRPYISESYFKLKTSYFKLCFIKYISENVDRCSGDWPNGNIPFDQSDASAFLARLEEKWLGLDR